MCECRYMCAKAHEQRSRGHLLGVSSFLPPWVARIKLLMVSLCGKAFPGEPSPWAYPLGTHTEARKAMQNLFWASDSLVQLNVLLQRDKTPESWLQPAHLTISRLVKYGRAVSTLIWDTSTIWRTKAHSCSSSGDRGKISWAQFWACLGNITRYHTVNRLPSDCFISMFCLHVTSVFLLCAWIPWDWSYHVALGFEPGSSQRATSALNHWVIFL